MPPNVRLIVGTDKGVWTFLWKEEYALLELLTTSLGDQSILSLVVQRSQIFTGTRGKEGGVFVSRDGGILWEPLLLGREVWALACDPEAQHLYAGLCPAGIEYSEDGGKGWRQLESLLQVPGVNEWSFPAPPRHPRIRTLAVDPKNSEKVYAGVEVGGLVCSPNRGKTWYNHSRGLHPDIHCLLLDQWAPSVLYVGTGKGFYRSMDCGWTWEKRSEELTLPYITALTASPEDSDLLLTSATPGPQAAVSSIYRTADGGDHWVLVAENLPYTISSLVILPPETVFAGTRQGQIYLSDDLGEYWTPLQSHLPGIRSMALLLGE